MQRPAGRRDTSGEPGARIAACIDVGVFRQRCPGGLRSRIGQPFAETIQDPVLDPRGHRPVGREASAEIMARRAGGIAHQHIGHAGSFAARQPGDHESIGRIERRVHIKWPARDHHGDDRDILRLQGAHRLPGAGQFLVQLQGCPVALEFGVGCLAKDHHGHIRLRFKAAIGGKFGRTAARSHGRCQPFPDGRGAGKLVLRQSGALPGNGPAARLATDIVRPFARDEQMTAGFDRQDGLVLQQHQRLAHGFARNRAMFRSAEQVVLPGIGARGGRTVIEQAKAQFHAQDPLDRLVHPGHRDFPGAAAGQEVVVDVAPGIGRHVHVDTGEQCLRAAFVGAACDLSVRVPVRHHETAEIHAILEHICQERLVAGHLHALPAGEAGHNGRDAAFDRRTVRGAVDIAKVLFRCGAVALVDAIVRPAIGEKVLGRGNYIRSRKEIGIVRIALQALKQRADIGCDELGIGGIAFIGPAPAKILRHRHRRGERPFLPGHADFLGGDFADLLDQRGIMHRAKADVMREDSGADDVGMAVHGIGPPHDRDAHSAIGHVDRRIVEIVGRLQPVRRRGQVVPVRAGVSAHEDRAEIVFAHIVRCDAAQIGLDKLADLFFQRHRTEQLRDTAFMRGIGSDRIIVGRPKLGMRDPRAAFSRSRRCRRRCTCNFIARNGRASGQGKGRQTSEYQFKLHLSLPIGASRRWYLSAACGV